MNNDDLPDSPMVIPTGCPLCFPDMDLVPRLCGLHEVHTPGLDDAKVFSHGFISGVAEAGGEGNRRWCEFFRRKR